MNSSLSGQTPNNDLKHSALGKISFAFCIITVLLISLVGFGAPAGILSKTSGLKTAIFISLSLSAVISTIIGIVDIRRKGSKKLLTKISLVICGGLVGLSTMLLGSLILLSKLSNG